VKSLLLSLQRDTARQLDWLERVKESHGSVEVNALASAREINDKGIYSVGNLSASSQSACRKVRCSTEVTCTCEVGLTASVADIIIIYYLLIILSLTASVADSRSTLQIARLSV